jgi:hypothetical protein
MNRKLHLALTLLMWIALPAIAIRYQQVWNELPARIATKFNAAGRAVGWMTPKQSLEFNLVVMGLMLVVFTGALLAMEWKNKPPVLQWFVLAACWGQVMAMLFIFESILGHALNGTPVYTGPEVFLAPGLIAVAGLLITRVQSRNRLCTKRHARTGSDWA